MKQHVLLGISGGIAAVKIPDLIALLQKEYKVSVIMTKGATAMISSENLEKEMKVKVYTDLFRNPIDVAKILKERKVEHTNLAGSANVFVIAPATANIIAKLASGIADDHLTTTVLASYRPVIICPSMNVHMWENPATQENINTLKSRGYKIINPDTGLLACGYEGQGRLADIQVIKEAVTETLQKSTLLKGKKLVVTAGGTIEPIDDIRHIANRSSGKMGVALAEQAFLAGADVTVLHSKTSVKPRFNIPQFTFETAEDLEKLLKKYIPESDICIHAAAVSDFTVKNQQKGKISSGKPIILELIPQKKLLNSIKKINPKILLIGFKALFGVSETQLTEKAKETLKRSDADFIIANDVKEASRGFEADTNEVIIIPKNDKEIFLPLSAKTEIAKQIIEVVAKSL